MCLSLCVHKTVLLRGRREGRELGCCLSEGIVTEFWCQKWDKSRASQRPSRQTIGEQAHANSTSFFSVVVDSCHKYEYDL